MMKLKKWSKKAVLLAASLGVIWGTSLTAFAFVPDDVNAEVQTESVQGETAPTETPETALSETPETTPEGNGQALTEPGNGQVQDNIKDGSSKEFYTITTANNNTYYLVIDHSSTIDNVYMLSRIDENDLKDFVDESITETPQTPPSVIIDEPETEKPAVETEPEKEAAEQTAPSGSMILFGLLAAGLLGVGAYVYFKIYKPRQEAEDTESEHMETEMFVTVNEDEEAKKRQSSEAEQDSEEE